MNKLIWDKHFYKSVLFIALPIALQNLIVFGVSLTDTVMLGQLGKAQISGAAQANQPIFLLQMVVFGIASGGAVLCSQYYGKNDLKAVRQIIGTVLSFAVAVAVIFFAAARLFPYQIMRIYVNDQAVIEEGMKYLDIISWSYIFFGISFGLVCIYRSVTIVKVSVAASLCAFFVNVFLNWVFIFGNLGAPRMEIRGAALASLIARIAEFMIVFTYTFFIEKKIKFRFKDILSADKLMLKDYAKYALPVCANESSWALATSAQSAVLGQISSDIIAANSIASVLMQLMTIMGFGIANATSVIVGTRIGEDKMDEAKRTGKTLMLLGIVIGLISALLVFILRKPFVSFYNIDSASKSLTESLIAIVAVVTFFSTCATVSIVGVLRGAGDTKFCMALELICLWGVALPLGMFAGWVLKLPVLIVYALLKIDEPIKTVIAYRRGFRDKTYKNVTR